MAEGDKPPRFCPVMSLRSSFSKEAMVPCIAEKCAFWDDLYGKCGQISQAERLADALSMLKDEIHTMAIRS